ncbi:hypothetical protein F5884DRAFT_683119 [Xylogone sp. PMI_703]|nr:hypothetical protein F5884DRAFT_683119 [Xylogone sp. PMI_703]
MGRSKNSFLGALAPLLALSGISNGYPTLIDALRARQISPGQLASSYDYIVVGGGQSGLVIANRLSENSTRSVLVVEYGYFDNNPGQLEPTSAFTYPPADLFNATSVPQPGLNNRQGIVYAASVVGGGSTVNGMLHDRGSADDYNNWEKLGNPGWGFDDLLPYFKKSTNFTPPRPDLAEQYNITWDIPDAWGTDGPIQITYPDWQWPTINVQWKAWTEVGVSKQVEGAAGDAYNAFWVPSNTDQQYRRSYARSGYFDPVKNRRNLQLLTGYRVNEVQFDETKRAESVTIQARGTPNGASTTTVKANQEIILCSGWMHTPQILQRSGIGPRALLEQAGIDVLVDLPGVGSNLQDHPAVSIGFTYQTDLQPNPSTARTNATFAQWEQQQWQQRKGPLSIGVGNALATVPLPILDPAYQSTISKAQAQAPASYLPSVYTSENIDGYVAQRDLLLQSWAKQDNGVVEIPFSGGGSTSLVLEKPLSRGTVRVNTTDKYAEPTVDYNTNVNPVDLDIFVAVVKFTRKWMAAPSMKQLTPVETTPGTSVTTDQQITNYAIQGMTPSTAHGCCTAAMAPQELAGVVSSNLTVYGVTGLSVGDISIFPMILATHPCASVYAVAEKAADLIKARYDPSRGPGSSSSTTSSSTSTTSTRSTTTTRVTTTTTTTTHTTTTSSRPACSVAKWGQCAGQGYTGCTVCAAGSTCRYSNPWYSQCL